MTAKQTSYSLPESLEHFDRFPGSASVRLPTVVGLFAISPATVWRRVRNGTLPKPYKLSERVTVWSVAELRAVLAATKVSA